MTAPRVAALVGALLKGERPSTGLRADVWMARLHGVPCELPAEEVALAARIAQEMRRLDGAQAREEVLELGHLAERAGWRE